MKIIIITDSPTTFCGVIPGIKPNDPPKNSVAGTKITPPPNPTNAPTTPESKPMIAKIIYSILTLLQICLIA